MPTAITPRFALGRIVATREALQVLREAGESPQRFLRRHAHGDWGALHPDDTLANERALRTGMRLLSALPPAIQVGAGRADEPQGYAPDPLSGGVQW